MSIARFAAVSQYFTSTDVNYLDANTAEIETDASGWDAFTNCSAVAQSATHVKTGSQALQLTSVAAGSCVAVTDRRFNVVAGTVLDVSYWVYTTHAGLTGTVEVDFDDAHGSYIGFVVNPVPTPLTQNAFTKVSYQFTVPAGATTAVVLAMPSVSGAGETLWIDTIFLGVAGMGANPATTSIVVPPNIPSGALMLLTLFKATHTAQSVPAGWSDAGQNYGGPGGSYRTYFKYAGASEANFTLTLGNSVNFVTGLSVYTGVARGTSISTWTVNRYTLNGQTDFADLTPLTSTAADQWEVTFVTASGFISGFISTPFWANNTTGVTQGAQTIFVSLGNITGAVWDSNGPLSTPTTNGEVFAQVSADGSKTVSSNVWVLRPALMTSKSDNVGITDHLTVALAKTITIANPVGITDSRTINGSRVITITDNVGVRDNQALSGHVSPLDRVGITDKLYISLKHLADPVNITDTISLFKQHVISDPVHITDSITVVRGLFRTMTTNNVGIHDSLTPLKIPVRTIDLQSNVQVLSVPTPIDIAFTAPDVDPQDTDWYSVVADQIGRALIIEGDTSVGKGSWDVWLRYGATVRRLCRYLVA